MPSLVTLSARPCSRNNQSEGRSVGLFKTQVPLVRHYLWASIGKRFVFCLTILLLVMHQARKHVSIVCLSGPRYTFRPLCIRSLLTINLKRREFFLRNLIRSGRILSNSSSSLHRQFCKSKLLCIFGTSQPSCGIGSNTVITFTSSSITYYNLSLLWVYHPSSLNFLPRLLSYSCSSIYKFCNFYTLAAILTLIYNINQLLWHLHHFLLFCLIIVIYGAIRSACRRLNNKKLMIVKYGVISKVVVYQIVDYRSVWIKYFI